MSVSIVSNHIHHQSPGIQCEFDLFHPLTSVTTEWHQCRDQPKLPWEEESTQSVLVNDELYISDPRRPVFYKYSIDKKSWYKLHTDVSNYALVTYHSKVVLIGGLKKGVYTDKCVMVLDDSDLEEKLNHTCPQFQNARAASDGEYLIVIDHNRVNTVWLFDGKEWTPIMMEGNLTLGMDNNFQIAINDRQVYVFSSLCTYQMSLDTLTKPLVNSSLKWEELKATVSRPRKSNVTRVGNQLVTVEAWGSKLNVYAYSMKSKAWVEVEDVNVSFQSIVSVIGVPSTEHQPKQLEMLVVGRTGTAAYGEREKVKVLKVIFCGELLCHRKSVRCSKDIRFCI